MAELGTFSLDELQSFKGKFGLGIERDLHFKERTLKEVMDARGMIQIKRHHIDPRIIYITDTPYFEGTYKLSNKQVRKIVFGRWKDKDSGFIIKKIEVLNEIKRRRVNYHMTNEEILADENNRSIALRIRLAVIEDVISILRREKSKIRKALAEKLKGKP